MDGLWEIYSFNLEEAGWSGNTPVSEAGMPDAPAGELIWLPC